MIAAVRGKRHGTIIGDRLVDLDARDAGLYPHRKAAADFLDVTVVQHMAINRPAAELAAYGIAQSLFGDPFF
jgi:hypothetical protein